MLRRLLGSIDQFLPPSDRGRARRFDLVETAPAVVRAGATKTFAARTPLRTDFLLMAVQVIGTNSAGLVPMFLRFDIALAYRHRRSVVWLARGRIEAFDGRPDESGLLSYPPLVPAGRRVVAKLTSLGCVPLTARITFAGAAISGPSQALETLSRPDHPVP